MNIILFDEHELQRRLARSDPRAAHILDVLRRQPSDSFDAGIINGPAGKGRLEAVHQDGLELSFTWLRQPPPPEAISLVIGLPRPQAARRILADVTSLGVAAMHFVQTDRGEPGYASSALWRSGEWRRHLINGAQQAFTTQLPEVDAGRDLPSVLADMAARQGCHLALDNYAATRPLGEVDITVPTVLAFGPERGWSERERDLLRSLGFELVNLGERVLKTDTACIAAVALVRARLGLI